ncbi:uncharacterized protein LOC121800619 [Salvia splendens]|uniref:uncharacterized protein LOC121800619 n=1 Tax=Salvia splendens TaxID=180675 RepID=UPI001C27D711|nr:uncharacterized protein LOC121800619 [Salvia splendens]
MKDATTPFPLLCNLLQIGCCIPNSPCPIPPLNGIEDLASLSKKIVETKKNKVFPLVYRRIELVLILPVATAAVERVFSAMKFVKTDLRNRIGDEWLNDTLVVYNERSIFASVSNERILKRFQDMDTRRNQLSRLTNAIAT